MKINMKALSSILFCLFLGNVGYSQNIETKQRLENSENGSTSSLVKEHNSEMKILAPEKENQKVQNTPVKKQPAVAKKENEFKND